MTIDRHLNLFYAYNQDNQLIENNLTRAWIVTLGFLSGQVRDSWMQLLLQEALAHIGQSTDDLPSFVQASFALQSWMDKTTSLNAPKRYLLTIAGDIPDISDGETTLYASVPDGWIYDYDPEKKTGYCMLVEAKLDYNPLDEAQIKSHAEWLGLPPAELGNHLLAISWFDVARSIKELRSTLAPNNQEARILGHLADYLAFFGYHIFAGFNFSTLKEPPQLKLGKYNPSAFGYFQNIPQIPAFRLIQSI